MNDLVFAEKLFDLHQTIMAPFFLKHQFAWEVLPEIRTAIFQLAQSLSEDFERIAEDIWVARVRP